MLLVILMSLSLVGIIAVQLYWIKNSIEDREEQFSNVVSGILSKVTDKIEEREIKDYSNRFLELRDSIGEFKSAHLSNFFFLDKDLNSNEVTLYQHGILEEDYNIASTFFDNGNITDTATVKSYTSRRTKTVFREEYGLDGKSYRLNPIVRLEEVGCPGGGGAEQHQQQDQAPGGAVGGDRGVDEGSRGTETAQGICVHEGFPVDFCM